jgi:hypothetical protein
LLLQSYTLKGLAVFTQYLLSIKVFNPEGPGPETIVVVMTDEGGMFNYVAHLLINPCFSPFKSTQFKSALNPGHQHATVLVGACKA